MVWGLLLDQRRLVGWLTTAFEENDFGADFSFVGKGLPTYAWLDGD